MQRIEKYLLEYSQDGRKAFIETHPQPVLVTQIEVPAGSEWSQFHTDRFHKDAVTQAPDLEDAQQEVVGPTESYSVFELTKSPDSPWQARVSVGRAVNTDVRLPHKSVSKLHAHFTSLDSGSISLADAGSRNGTMINGQQLEPGSPKPVSAGDLLTFGQVTATFHTPESFADFLGELLGKATIGSPPT